MKYLLSAVLICFFNMKIFSQGVKFTLSEEMLNNSVKSIAEAGKLTGYQDIIPDFDFPATIGFSDWGKFKAISYQLKEPSIDLVSGQNMVITCKADFLLDYYMDSDYDLGDALDETLVIQNKTITMNCSYVMVVDSIKGGYYVKIKPNTITYSPKPGKSILELMNDLGWYSTLNHSKQQYMNTTKDLLEWGVYQTIVDGKFLPKPFELKIGLNVFSDVDQSVFNVSNGFTITTTNTDISAQFPVFVQPPVIYVFNDLLGQDNFGYIENFENNFFWKRQKSGFSIFDNWPIGTIQKVRTPISVLNTNSLFYKYDNFSKIDLLGNKIPQTEIEPRSININVEPYDYYYSAFFGEARKLTLTNYSDGIINNTGNFNFNGKSLGAIYDDYEIKNDIINFSLTSSISNTNGLSYAFLSWSDGVTTPQRTILLNQNRTLTANWKAHLSSKQSGWVNNTSLNYNFNGKEAVLYKSDGHLWLHVESVDEITNEIKVADASENPHDYSVVKYETGVIENIVCYVNNNNKIVVKSLRATGLVSFSKTFTETFPANIKPKLMVGTSSYYDPQHCENPEGGCLSSVSRLGVLYQTGSSIIYQVYDLTNGFWFGNWLTDNSSVNLGTNPIEVSTNGSYGYIYWKNSYNLYCRQFTNGFGSSIVVSNQSYLGSNIFSIAGAVNYSGNLILAYTQQRGNFSNVFTRTVYPDGNMSTESSIDMTYTPNTPPTQYYYPTLMSAESSRLLLEIGKTAPYSSPWYVFWKHDGSTWKKQNWTSAPQSLKKMLHGEADDYPKEVTISSLYKLDTAPVTTLGALNKINEGTKQSGSHYFSIVAQSLTDTSSYYIDLEPTSVDSIVVDTLNIWHLVLKNASISAELISDLNHWGNATYSEPNKTVVFIPDYEKRYYFTIDPASNSARMNKVNSETSSEINSITENKVSVFPNPFNPTTQINIQVKEKSFVKIEVYNLVGQQVMSEIRNGVHGKLVVPFNGSRLSSGTYFYQVSINEKVFKGKLKLVK